MDLKEYIDQSSDFLRIADGEVVRVKYLGYKVVPNRFDPDAVTVRYLFSVDGKEKTFDSRSVGLAEVFSRAEIGCLVDIKRVGEGNQTRYQAKVVKDLDASSPSAALKEQNKTAKEVKEEMDGLTDKDIEDFGRELNENH